MRSVWPFYQRAPIWTVIFAAPSFYARQAYPVLPARCTFPLFFANFTTACFFLASCVIIFMRSYFLSVFGFVVKTLYHIWKLTSLFIGSHHFNTYRILTDMYKIYSFVFAPLAKIAETQHKKRPQRVGESFAAFGKYCRTTYRAGRQTICQLKAQYAAGGCNAREGALPTLLN